MDVVYQTQTNIADSSKDFQMQKAAFDQEVNTRKAEAELSYELQVNLYILGTGNHAHYSQLSLKLTPSGPSFVVRNSESLQ